MMVTINFDDFSILDEREFYENNLVIGFKFQQCIYNGLGYVLFMSTIKVNETLL